VDVGLVRLRFAPGGRLVAPRTDDLGVALIYVEVGTITTRNTDPLMVMRGAQTPEQVPAETDVRLEAGDSLFAAPGSGGSSTTTGPGKRTSCSPSSRRSWPPRRPRSRSKQTRDEGRIAFRPSRSRVPSRHQRTPPFVKRVPVTPQLGISFSDFPLNCVSLSEVNGGISSALFGGKRIARPPYGSGPMTRLSRAVSTTSLVIVRSRLISSTRATWLNSRCTSRKLPPVMRAIAASASASV
jgi:hypothetical protein